MFGRDLRRAQWLARVGSRLAGGYKKYGPGSVPFAIGGSGIGLTRTYQKWNRKAAVKRKMQAAGRAPKRRKINKVVPVHHEPQGNGVSTVIIPAGKQWVKNSILEAAAPNFSNLNAGFQLTCGVGVQGYTSRVLGGAPDLKTLASKINVGGISSANIFYLDEMRQEFTMTNASTFSGKLTIYDITPLRDIYTNNAQSPDAAWNNGLVDELAAGLASDVGSTPYMSDLFNQFYRVVKTTTTEIQPGGTHKHVVIAQPNAKLHYEVLNLVTQAIRKISVFSLFVLEGLPAHDSTTKTQVSTSGCSLDIVLKIFYKHRYIMDNTVSYYRTNNLVSSFTVGPEVVNEEIGQLQNAAGITATAGVY